MYDVVQEELLFTSIPSSSNISCFTISVSDSELYLGYSTGSLTVYKITSSFIENSSPSSLLIPNSTPSTPIESPSSTHSLCKLILSKPQFSKKSIDTLYLSSNSNLLLTFTDNTAFVHDAHSLQLIQALKDVKSPLSSDFTFLSTENAHAMAIGMHRKLILYKFNPPFTVLKKREYTLPFTCRSISFHPQSPIIAIASSKEIQLLNIDSMETTLLHSWNITSFSLRSSGKVGVKIMSQGLMAFNNQLLIKIEDDVQAKSDWTVVLEDLMCLHPFNFGLLQGSKTIQVKLNEQLVQVLQFHTPIKWCATNFFVYIVEDSLLKRFALLPLEHIISKLKEHHQYDACVDLIEASDLSRDDKRQFLHATRLENAYHLFKTNAYPEAMHWFKELCIPPSSIISLFPFFPFLSSLVEKLGGGGIPILGIEKTVSSTTPESKKILSRFLSDWRSMLNRLRLTFSDPQFLPFTNASIQASSSSLHSTSSSLLTKLSNEWNPEEVHREAIIIDTALLQLYLIENSDAMLGPLVRVKNLCDIEITTELLWSHQKYSQLIEFYQGKEMHGGALKTLKQLYSIPGTDASPYYKDLSSHFLYLHRLETIESEFPLIFDHLRWILEIDSKQALEFFYATTLPTQRVIDFLASNVPAYDVLNYIEHKLEMEVNEKNFDQDLHLHYLKYLVLGIQAEPENGSFTTKLRSHLEKESILVLGMAMGIIPDTFFEEQFILFKRTNETLKCFCLLIEKIQDLERAKSFVNEVGQFHNELILASHRSCDPKLQVLVQLYAEHLSLATLCQVLDANVCLKDIHSCLASAYARSQAALHQSILTRNLAGKEKTIYQLQLAKLHLGSVIIDDVVLCCICKKRIGTSAFVTWKDTRKVAHYGCQSSLMSR